MRIKKLAMAAAATALAAAPIAAQTNAFAQNTAPVAGESEIGGDSTTQLVVLAGVIIAIVLLTELTDSDDDAPVSV